MIPADTIRVECDGGAFDRFTSIEIVTDLTAPSEATMVVNDNDAWRELSVLMAPGRPFRVIVNDRLQLTGRAESNEGGDELAVTIRTVLSDAAYASADPKIRFTKRTIKDFLLALFEPLELGASVFNFAPAADRDIMTGKALGALPIVDLTPLKVDQAKVNPPETIWEAAIRVLKRFHMTMWDTADGRINVGAPSDGQRPAYRLVSKRTGGGRENNVLRYKRIADLSEVPSEVWVYGGSPGADVTRAPFRGVAVDLDATVAGFRRRVILPAEGVRSIAQADAQAARELSARSRRKSAWEIDTPGLAYWTGTEKINYAINTTADVDIDTAAGASGRFLVHRLARTLTANESSKTTLTVVAPGIWTI